MIQIGEDYFDWMCDFVCDLIKKRKYRKLLSYLDSVEFTFSVPMDGNRYEDGIDLRYRFGYEQNIRDTTICKYLDCRPCSVLEMMIALVLRCEEIMTDDQYGDRTPEWFWSMIENLELVSMDNESFDEEYAEEHVAIFLERQYAPNGTGGLFKVLNYPNDMRDVDIWCQLMWWLDDELRGE